MDVSLNIERLVKCRESLGISKIEAARRINVSQPAYVRYEGGTRSPSIQVIGEMAKAFGTTVAYLTGQSDIPTPDYIILNKNDSPEMYTLVEACKKLPPEQFESLKAFLAELGKE